MTTPPESPKVVAGFVSFTEVAAGEHHSYNAWHLFDHLPEQLPLHGIAWGERWVLTPAMRQHAVAEPPLDRVHYLTLYLMGEPLDATIAAFQALATQLHAADRFHRHRTSHLSGQLLVRSTLAAPRALVSPEAVPYRPNTGIHVRARRLDAADASALDAAAGALVDMPGVTGAWTFEGLDLHVTWCWLDGDLTELAGALAPGEGVFGATLATIDPFGAWDWFD